MSRILKRGLQFLHKRNTFRYAFSVTVALLVIASAVSLSGGGRHAHAAVTLAPETIGLGQGTAACASSAGAYCAGTYLISFPISWNEVSNGVNNPSCGIQGDVSLSIFVQDPNGRLLTLGGQPCSGSATLTFNATGPNSYGVWIYGEQSGTYYDVIPGNAYNEAYAFNGPGNNCAPVTGVCSGSINNCAAGSLGATATYPNYPVGGQTTYQWWCNGSLGGSNTLCSVTTGAATPTGSITGISPNPCNIARGQTACQPAVSWTTANTNGVVAINIQGWAPYSAETWIGAVPTSGAEVWPTALPVGAYDLKLWGQDGAGAWNYLDIKRVTVVPPPPSSITASCPAPGTTATFSWPAVYGADEYQIQYTSATHSCAPGWTLFTDGTTCYADIGTNSISIPTTPGMSSGAWVNAANSQLGWGDWNQQPSTGFTCGGVPSGSVSASSCTIANGDSTCSVPVTWVATDSQTTQLNVYANNGSNCPWDVPTGCTSASWVSGTNYFPSGPSGGSATLNFPPGSYLPTAFGTDASGTWHNFPAVGVTASCVSGTTWDSSSSKCVGSGPTCSPACTGGQTCVATNTCACPSGETLVGGVCTAPPSCSPACTGGQTCVATNTCACPSGESLVGGVCAVPVLPPTILSFTVSPNRVRSGGSTTITWLCSSGATDASITGQNGFNFPHAGNSGSVESGPSHGGAPITAQTNFTLTCSNSSGHNTATQTVFLLPSEIEQ